MMTNQYLEKKVFELEKRVEKIELSKIISDLPSVEPCKDVISREAVIDTLTDNWEIWQDANDAMQKSIDDVRRLSSVQPSRKGHWKIDSWLWSCDNCNKTYHKDDARTFKFCPNCGVDMRGDTE